MRDETNSRVAMSLLGSPSLTRRTTSSLLGGQRRALSLCGVKVLLAHGIARRPERGIVSGLVDRKRTTPPDRLSRPERAENLVVACTRFFVGHSVANLLLPDHWLWDSVLMALPSGTVTMTATRAAAAPTVDHGDHAD